MGEVLSQNKVGLVSYGWGRVKLAMDFSVVLRFLGGRKKTNRLRIVLGDESNGKGAQRQLVMWEGGKVGNVTLVMAPTRKGARGLLTRLGLFGRGRSGVWIGPTTQELSSSGRTFCCGLVELIGLADGKVVGRGCGRAQEKRGREAFGGDAACASHAHNTKRCGGSSAVNRLT